MTAVAEEIAPAKTRRRFTWPPLGILASFLFLAVVLFVAVFGPAMVRDTLAIQDLLSVGRPPSAAHWFGTDELGQDVFARVIAGARPAVVGPLIVATSGLIVSALVGILAGYQGGTLDNIILRVVDFIFSLPSLLLTIVIVAVTGGGYWMAILVLSILNVQGDIRIIRGIALKHRALPYIEAARAVGIPQWKIMYRHILSNILPILMANYAIDFSGSLVALSGLAFLGLGSQPGTPEWGRMLTTSQELLSQNPMAAIAPGLAIILLATSVTLIGDWLYERHSSRDRRTR